MTPQEAWSGRKLGVGHLKVFGSIADALVPEQRRNKLDDRSKKLVFISYDSRTKGYKLYDPRNGKVTLNKDVEVNEDRTWEWKAQEEWNNSSMVFEEEEVQETKELEGHTPSPPSSPSQSGSPASSSLSSSSSSSQVHRKQELSLSCTR